MSLTGLVLLQAAALTGLVIGARTVLLQLLVALPAAALVAGAGAGALAVLALVGFALGAHLRRVVAERYARP
jgi:hypothetical protein